MNSNYVLSLPDNLLYLNEELSLHLNNKLQEITSFLGIDKYDQIRIFVYDNADEFKKICHSPYPLSSLAGSFGHDNVRVFVDNTTLNKEKLFNCICHECIHLLYQNYVQEKGIQNRVIWFDEGLALNLSGEHDKELDEDNLREYLENKVFKEGKILPDIAFLNIHGNKYGQFIDSENKTYSGYTWSYLMLRYLIETLSKGELNILMRHKGKIKERESTIIDDTYSYFKKRRVLRQE